MRPDLENGPVGGFPARRRGRNLVLSAVCVLLALVLSGCLRVSESIRVTAMGGAEIEVDVKGEAWAFDAAADTPGGASWITRELPVDNRGKDKPERHLVAVLVAAPGEDLPSQYVDPARPDAAAHLRFPTSVRTWSEDGRTFYEFRRTYQARRWQRFADPPLSPEEKQLEERILDGGIFAASEGARRAYCDLLRRQARAVTSARVVEAAGSVVAAGGLAVTDLDAVLSAADGFMMATLSDDNILRMLSMDDKGLDKAFEDLSRQLGEAVAAATEKCAPGIGSLVMAELANVDAEWNITMRLGNNGYRVDLELPGRVIRTNGMSTAASPGRVSWEFEGKDLRDRDLPLYALSIVEAPRKDRGQ
jgi:hypothetical protein